MITIEDDVVRCHGQPTGKQAHCVFFRRNDSMAWNKGLFVFQEYTPAEQFRVIMCEGSGGTYYADMSGKTGLAGISECAVFIDNVEVEREVVRCDDDGLSVRGLPIVERIAGVIESTLKAMGPETFSETVLDVQRRELPVNAPTDRLCVLAMDDPEELGATGESENCRDWIQIIYAVVYCIGEDNPDRAQNLIWSDIYRAIMADQTLGGIAFEATVMPYERLPDCMAIPIRVQYRTSRTDLALP